MVRILLSASILALAPVSGGLVIAEKTAAAAASGGRTIVNFAGDPAGVFGNGGDGGPATAATLDLPDGVAVDSAGNVYISDFNNNRVRKVGAGGAITGFAGSPAGTAGNGGDGGPATSATLSRPTAVAVDSAGNVYISDFNNNRVRKVDAGGTITGFAGSAAGTAGNGGDGGPATSATLSSPGGVAVDSAGNVFISDTNNSRVRRVDAGGIITGFAGDPAGAFGNGGDGGPATSATLGSPGGVAVDSGGNVFISDTGNGRVRRVDAGGIITGFAGDPAGALGNGGDGGPASSATLSSPQGVAVDAVGSLYIADGGNNRVREVLAATTVPPLFTSAASATFTVGVAGTFPVTATGYPAPTMTEIGALPSGVTFDRAIRTLNGTPTPGTAGSYPIIFGAANGIGTGATQNFTLTVAALPGYSALVPVRICDTRPAGPGVTANQCDTGGKRALSTGGVLNVTVAGAVGVPADATAVVLHVTATATSAASYLTVWPTGQAQPTAANLNWSPSETVPNLVQTGVGTGGQISVFNYAGNVDVIVDLQGYVRPSTGSLFVPTAPRRVCDTRAAQPANQCNQATAGTVGDGQTRAVNVVTGFGVPAGATAVVLNVTATTTSTTGYLTVYPAGVAAPIAASLNWAAGQTISNRVVTAVSATGSIDVFNAHGNADVVIDLGGYYTATAPASGYFALPPNRICDTRPIGAGVASNVCNNHSTGPLTSMSALTLFGFNPNATALVVNVTVTRTAGAGYLTVFSADSPALPLAADLTWTTNQTIGNLVVADLGTTGAMQIFNGSSANTDVIIDVVGYYNATTPTAATTRAATRTQFAPTGAKRTTKRQTQTDGRRAA